jgi:hypothetical protein
MIMEGANVGWEVNSYKVSTDPNRNHALPQLTEAARDWPVASPDFRVINRVHLPTRLDGECQLCGQALQPMKPAGRDGDGDDDE